MGFWGDVGDLRRAIDVKVQQGRGSKALPEALAEMPSPQAPSAKSRNHKKTFLISAIFGMIWQSTRRR